MDELSEDDKLTVARARKIQKFLSQPFVTAEVFTGHKGKLVPLKVSPLFKFYYQKRNVLNLFLLTFRIQFLALERSLKVCFNRSLLIQFSIW